MRIFHFFVFIAVVGLDEPSSFIMWFLVFWVDRSTLCFYRVEKISLRHAVWFGLRFSSTLAPDLLPGVLFSRLFIILLFFKNENLSERTKITAIPDTENPSVHLSSPIVDRSVNVFVVLYV